MCAGVYLGLENKETVSVEKRAGMHSREERGFRRLLTSKGELEEWVVPQMTVSGTRAMSEALPCLIHVWAG